MIHGFFTFLAVVSLFSAVENKTSNETYSKKQGVLISVKTEESNIDTLGFLPEYLNKTSSLGIGTVNPKDYTFTLFLDTLKQKFIKIEDVENQKHMALLIYKPDYLIFYMVVEEKINNWYKIIFNYDEIGYVLEDEFTFYTWRDLLGKVEGMAVKEGCIEKDNRKSLQELSEQDFYLIEQIDKEWIYVRKEIEEDVLEENGYWVKWKERNELKITPIFLN